MKYTVSFQYCRALLTFLIKKEQDGIFIALPKEKHGWGESIFLTKTEGQWVGDSSDKKLVEKLGAEIEAARWQKRMPRKKPA